MSQHSKLDDAALHAVHVFGFALAGSLVPTLFFRRWRVFTTSTTFALGLATGVTWRDVSAMLREEKVVKEEITVFEEKKD
jgi:hypothetical protein